MADHKTRISNRLREAVRLMVEDGLTRSKAAETAGMTDHGLYVALRKDHVRAMRREIVDALRESEASKTFARVSTLADNADSEHVRLNASTWLGEVGGISPIQRSEATINHNLGPGLTIVVMDREPQEQMLGLSTDVTPRTIAGRAVQAPVAHPALVKREQSDAG